MGSRGERGGETAKAAKASIERNPVGGRLYRFGGLAPSNQHLPGENRPTNTVTTRAVRFVHTPSSPEFHVRMDELFGR
jgi:hypothetical protein